MKPLENFSEKQIELFDSYINLSMSQTEAMKFEEALNSDKNLSEQFEAYKDLISGIELAALKSKMDAFHGELGGGEMERSTQNRYGILKWSVAAAVVAALGIFWMLNTENSNEKLFAAHFKPDPGLPTMMSTSSNFEFYDGMVSYKQGNYTEAIEKWNELSSGSVASDTLYYFLGVAHLAKGNTDMSIDYLKKLWIVDGNHFKDETAYYLGMAYLKSGHIENAIKYLTFSNTEDAHAVLSEITN